MYYNGLGVKQNKIEALSWIQKAAEQGLDQAQKTLEFLGTRRIPLMPNLR
jgi:TPR repeat protein